MNEAKRLPSQSRLFQNPTRTQGVSPVLLLVLESRHLREAQLGRNPTNQKGATPQQSDHERVPLR